MKMHNNFEWLSPIDQQRLQHYILISPQVLSHMLANQPAGIQYTNQIMIGRDEDGLPIEAKIFHSASQYYIYVKYNWGLYSCAPTAQAEKELLQSLKEWMLVEMIDIKKVNKAGKLIKFTILENIN